MTNTYVCTRRDHSDFEFVSGRVLAGDDIVAELVHDLTGCPGTTVPAPDHADVPVSA